jgi:gamma-butyrobetaine dioxygenase
VLDLFGRRGDGTYGEAVDQRRHALQCADRAVATGAPDALVAAALLHDIGHLLSGPDVPGVDRTTEDDRHEAVGARFLAPRFGPDVSRPVALHVMAKRYRCTVDPDYYGGLSPTSRATLVAQGGRLDAGALARFERLPGFVDALAVRDWDEQAKDPTRDVAGLDTYVPVLWRLADAVGSKTT